MVEVTEAHKFATALIGVERFTADGNFHPDYLAMLDKYRQAGVQQGLDMAAGVAVVLAEPARPLVDQLETDRKADEAAATVIQQAFAERDGRLADHVAVHRAMLQGHIAKPSPANIWHLYQRDLLDAMPDEFKAERDGEIERLRNALDKAAARLNLAANYMATSFDISGTLRAERTIKLQDCAAEALAAKGDSRG